MTEAIHAHEIIEMASANSFSLDELKSKILSKYGKDVQFTKCCGNMFTTDEILEFLFNVKKFVTEEGIIKVKDCNSCSN